MCNWRVHLAVRFEWGFLKSTCTTVMNKRSLSSKTSHNHPSKTLSDNFDLTFLNKRIF